MTEQLFAPPKARQSVDWMNEYARRKLNAPEGWRWFRWTRKGKGPGEFFVVEGAVCTAVFTKGKRKGLTNWNSRDKSTEMEFAVRDDDLTALEREWERETGRCATCYGSGDEWTGWSLVAGNRFKPCTGCGATGIAPKREAA